MSYAAYAGERAGVRRPQGREAFAPAFESLWAGNPTLWSTWSILRPLGFAFTGFGARGMAHMTCPKRVGQFHCAALRTSTGRRRTATARDQTAGMFSSLALKHQSARACCPRCSWQAATMHINIRVLMAMTPYGVVSVASRDCPIRLMSSARMASKFSGATGS